MAQADAMFRGMIAKGLKGEVSALSLLLDLLEMIGWFEESTEENQNRAPLILPPPLPLDEWQVLAGLYLENQHERQSAWAEVVRGLKPSEARS